MKILYLTTESYFREPIIKSQVKTLLEYISVNNNNIKFTLITFDDIEQKKNHSYFNENFKHYVLKNRGHLLNIINGVVFTLINAKQYDIIHVRSYPLMIGGLLAKLFHKKKLIFDPRGLYADELLYVNKNKILFPIFKLLENLSCKYSNNIVVVSQPFKKYLFNKYNIKEEKITVITTFSVLAENHFLNKTNLIDIKNDIFHTPNAILFVYSGSIEKWQMIDETIHFFNLIYRNIENARFIFLSKAKQKFKDYLSDKMPSDKYFIESVDNEILPFYLSQCDYSVIFRDNNIINQVSAPIKVKDYLLSGLPIIMTDRIGDSSSFIKENNLGFIVNGVNEHEMSKVIMDIKKNKVLFDKEQIINVAKSYFDVNIIAEKYCKLYKNI